MVLSAAGARAQGCRQDRVKIVGGNVTRLDHWPGQAVLRVRSDNAGPAFYFCGAAAISERWVLTAANCVFDHKDDVTLVRYKGNGENFTGKLEVVIGVADLNSVIPANVFAVDKIEIAEGYSGPSGSGHDLALIKLKRSYTGPVARLSLQSATDPATPPGAQVRTAGFGSLSPQAKYETYRRKDGEAYKARSRHLHETALPTVAIPECKARNPSSNIDEGQLCAGFEVGGLETCSSDSGDPLVAYDRHGCPFQIGVASSGTRCASAKGYSIYSRVSYHANWLARYVNNLRAVDPSLLQANSTDVVSRDFTRAARLQLEDILAAAKGRVTIEIRGGNTVSLGNQVVYQVRSVVAGRLLVIDINAAGEVVQLIPNEFTTKKDIGWIQPGRDYTIPSREYGFAAFEAVEPVGRGQLIALVLPATFPMAIFDTSVIRSKGFVAVNTPTNYFMNLIQSIAAAVRDTDPQLTPFGLAVTEYEIVR
jgi:secreted trypsin-like serine protease